MHPNDTNSATDDKPQGSTVDKSGVISIDVPDTDGGMRLEAEHVIDPGRAGRKQIIYLGPKQDGIDFIATPFSVTARSDRAQDILEAHTDDDSRDGEEPRTDGHADDEDIHVGDVVTVRDEDRRSDAGPWKVEDIDQNDVAALWSCMQSMRREPVADLVVVETAEDTTHPHHVPDGGDGDDDPTIMTDGGRVQTDLSEFDDGSEENGGDGDSPWTTDVEKRLFENRPGVDGPDDIECDTEPPGDGAQAETYNAGEGRWI